MAATAFRREFIELIGSRPDEGDVRIAEMKLKGATSTDRSGIRQYISSLPQFRNKYEDIITKVYTINCDVSPDEDTIQFFLKRFATPDYGPDNLADDIANGVNDAADDNAETAKAVFSPATEIEQMLGFAKRWQSATGKKVDIYEFIRYYHECPDKKTIARVSESQETALLYVDKVHRDYLGRGVSKDEFLERYLFEHEKPHFDAEVLATVLGGEEYRMEMCKQICASYKKLFGVDMHKDDTDHVFELVRGRRCGLYSEDINEELIKANDLLREIADHVDAAYREVFCRNADSEEIRECVATFRAYGADFAVSELKSRLYDSLEFHDVIKDRFKDSFEKKHGRRPKTREVYEALARILHENASNMGNALANI